MKNIIIKLIIINFKKIDIRISYDFSTFYYYRFYFRKD